MPDFLSSLFDTSGFPPRWTCGAWTPLHGWIHVVSDLLVWGAYTAIPLALAYFVRTRKDVTFPRIFWLFVAFIFACGTVHLVEASIFWWPWYRLSALIKAATAIVSWITVFALVRVAPAALRLPSVAHLSAIVESSQDAIIAKDLDGRITAWNRGAEKLYGYRRDDVLGQDVRRLVPPEGLEEQERFMALLRGGVRVESRDTRRVHRDGRVIDVSLTLSPIRNGEGRVVGASDVTRDVSDRKRAESELQDLARKLETEAKHDPLTGLANRRGLEEALTRELAHQRRHGGHMMAVMIDMDDFKAINDTHGHAAGDAVLREGAHRMAARLRPDDVLARVGGDEFLALLPGTRRAEARQVAERLRLAVAESTMDLSGQTVRITASFGLADVPEDLLSLEEVLTLTRDTLARGKRDGKNRVAESEARARLHAVADPGADTLRAVERDGALRVFSQPVLDLASRDTVARELLVRGPRGPYESPYDLFRLSMERNALTAVDLACLRTCVRAGATVPGTADLHVNLFPGTILETPAPRLMELFDAGGGPRRFCIDISEQQVLGDPAALRDKLQELRQHGVRIALDDVGFGRSSLEALILLEPDVVKIDRAFVHGVADDDGRSQRLDRIVRCVTPLTTAVVAEGLEREEDAAALLRSGVRLAQGYLLGRPAEVQGSN